jgi:hypothetical protein
MEIIEYIANFFLMLGFMGGLLLSAFIAFMSYFFWVGILFVVIYLIFSKN